jgi:Gluconate 2-dehydrogenase subunit 3
MAVSRRNALKTLGAAAAAAPLFDSRSFHLQVEDLPAATLSAIAEVVLPSEADRKAAVTAFTAWIANYKEGADTDHGYGNTRVRSTGPSPARNYPAQIAALDAAAKAKGAAGFAAATLDQRRAVVEAAIADAKVERLPARPTGAHIAVDLMGHYFNSSAASDLCYRAAIGRDACRGLAGSEKAPVRLSPKVDLPPKGGSYT